jgi:hypothetical protein
VPRREGAEGFLTAKLNGTRQLALAITGGYSHPIPTPIQNFPSVANSCENCHHPNRFVGDVIKVLYEHADDESNTETKTTLRIHVGGPIGGTGTGSGIHWHMNRSNQVEFVALDDKREQIPYVRVSTPDGRVREIFRRRRHARRDRRQAASADWIAWTVTAVRRTHLPPRPNARSTPQSEPVRSVRRFPSYAGEAVRALKGTYTTTGGALRDIDRSIREAMNTRLPHDLRGSRSESGDRRDAGDLHANVFPSMKVGMGHVSESARTHDIDRLFQVP